MLVTDTGAGCLGKWASDLISPPPHLQKRHGDTVSCAISPDLTSLDIGGLLVLFSFLTEELRHDPKLDVVMCLLFPRKEGEYKILLLRSTI